MRLIRILIISLLLVVLLLGASWFALDAWLESAGGRDMIAGRLSDSLGQPVSLGEDFNVVLLPAPGVSGSDLKVGATASQPALAYAGAYLVEMDGKALLDRRVLINAIEVENLAIQLESGPFYINRLRLEGFELGQAAPFSLSTVVGSLKGQVTVSSDLSRIRFEPLTLSLSDQTVTGEICYSTAGTGLVAGSLKAERLDLEKLRQLFQGLVPAQSPDDSPGAQGFELPDLPVELAIEVEADVVNYGDTIARGVKLMLGDRAGQLSAADACQQKR